MACSLDKASCTLAKLRDFAPYAVIELMVPGGSVVALLVWLYRRRQRSVLVSSRFRLTYANEGWRPPGTMPYSGSLELRAARGASAMDRALQTWRYTST
jgi:hypothetical protein